MRGIGRAYRESFTGLAREVWLLSVVALVNRAGTMVLPFLALFLTHSRRLPVVEAGRLVALYGLGSLVGSYLGGWLSDRIGSVRTVHLGLLLAGIGYLGILRTETTAALALAIFLTSVVAESTRPAVMTAIAHRAPPGTQARSFALLRLAVNLGMAVGPAVGGVLATHRYSWLFLGDAATSWLASLLLLLLVPAARVGSEARPPGPPAPVRPPWRDVPFLLLLVVVMLWASAFFQVFSTMPIYLRQEYGMRENVIGAVIGFNAVLIVLFEMVLIRWAEGRARLPLMAAGSLLVCGGLGLLPLGASVGWAIVSTATWTLGEMLTLPLSNALVAERASPAARGRYMGLYTMAFSSAFIFAPIGGTWLFARLGPDTVWYAVALLGPPLFAACLALAGRLGSPPPAPLLNDEASS